ncbi:MAG TPA: malectin domain-containing carbohydrate-binding protein [Candidatus Acidoferrum sp.]|nr:malectin domain-containing carbohydrate-binding protein [Candidatus Acidoferrum sp.]
MNGNGRRAIGLTSAATLVSLAHLAVGASLPRYYAHEANLDKYGVIAPWYHGLNGQCDYRVRIAAETLKRYPWTTMNQAVAAYPHYVFSGTWQISSNGIITPRTPSPSANGDIGQRAVNALNGWVDYYRYTGDPAAIAHVTYMADFIVTDCVTPADHPWPGLFISAPAKGKAYGKADPHGWIQLDLCAAAGRALVRASQLTGNTRWFETATHWADLLAARCNLDPAADPWPRYANPEDTPWKDNKQTGGVTMILAFLDQLIALGYTGEHDSLVPARDAGRRYLRDRLLPAWTVNDTWGRYFWDWANPVQNCLTTPDAARYLIEHPEAFPNWRVDARNILTLFLNRSSVSPDSLSDVYDGAWAYPEANNCCGRSLWYSPVSLAPTLAEWAVQAGNPWGRELAYRQLVLQTYDAHDNGVTEDDIDGGVIVNGDWFNIAHPLPLRFLLEAIGWLPEELGASRENHVVRSSAVINSIVYAPGRITYSTFEAPASTVEVLRLAFSPDSVLAGGERLHKHRGLQANGYTVKKLPNGDAILTIRHDGQREVEVSGRDPQQMLSENSLVCEGGWRHEADGLVGQATGAALTAAFEGNQVRLIGVAGPSGGLAEVYLDGEKQWAPVDCWNPAPHARQVLYYRNGLPPGPHVLRVVARGEHNPYSLGTRVQVEGVEFSAASEAFNYPSGTGPQDTQRMIFGYTARQDYRDSQGHLWRPATEFITRIGRDKDSIQTWWTTPATCRIENTRDPELYRHGVHCPEFWVPVTVAPGTYHARLKFASARGAEMPASVFDVLINGHTEVENLDVAATAGGQNRAVDLVFNDITPRHGIIEIRLRASGQSGANGAGPREAFLQALEVGPGSGGQGGRPISARGF